MGLFEYLFITGVVGIGWILVCLVAIVTIVCSISEPHEERIEGIKRWALAMLFGFVMPLVPVFFIGFSLYRFCLGVMTLWSGSRKQ